MRWLAAPLLLFTLPLLCQVNEGELRIRVADPSGLGVRTAIQILSSANRYLSTLSTNDEGYLRVQLLPYGIYQLRIEQSGYASQSQQVEIRSSLPAEVTILLRLAIVDESVTVNALDTMANPYQPGSGSRIGSEFVRERLGSIPGRDLQDLVNSQPGWLYESNAVLHPRGSEYQTQFVVDGIPLTDNRSPSFGPPIEADDVESMSVFTAGIPAEYGRKMGGVVEVNTLQNPQRGFHGQVVMSDGSFNSSSAFGKAQYVWGKNTLSGSASGSTTEHYLNPVVPQNFSNTGTVGDSSMSYARDLTQNDRFKVMVRRELARYDIPNEMVQQAAAQRQNADNFETMGIASYEHIFSPTAAGDLRGMARDNSNEFYSSSESTPIIVLQHNWFREGYFKSSLTFDHGRNEWKAGIESDNTFLNEKLNYSITDPTQFDPGSPTTFAYQANRPDLEQSGFVQDVIRLHNWTINAGLRWDHYQLLLNQHALQPRFAVSHYFQKHDAVIHFSYDRIFQRRPLKTFCYRVHLPLLPSIQRGFSIYLLSHRKATTMKRV